MKEKRKIKTPKFAALTSFLATGAVLIIAGGVVSDWTRIAEYENIAEKNYCTILVYMDGSDLESDYEAATADLKEMEDALTSDDSNKDVRIVVEAGGSAKWHYEPIAENHYSRFMLDADGITNIQSMNIRNMGNPDTLADFINYGTQSYPAEHYGLVLWNHGAGQIAGFGSDSNYPDDSLTLLELNGAFDELTEYRKEFDFISLDACLMANYELVSLLEDNTKYLIASEELEPQDGYDYAWIEEIKKEQMSDTEELGMLVGKKILATYQESYRDEDYRIALSLINTDAYAGFDSAFSEIMETAIQNADDDLFQQIGKQRNLIGGFGDRSQNEVPEIVDIMDVTKIITTITDNTAAYEELQKQYSMLVIDEVNNGYGNEPCGLSIYLPSGSNDTMINDMELYMKIPFSESYQQFIGLYEKYLRTEREVEWIQPQMQANMIQMELNPEMIDTIITAAYLEVFYELEDDEKIILISSDSSNVRMDKNGYIKATPEVIYWGMKGELLCMIEIVNTNQYTEYMVPILYNGERCNMFIYFDEDNPNGKIVSIEPLEIKKQTYQIQEGDVIIPLYPMEEMEPAEPTVHLPSETGIETEANMFYEGEEIVITSIDYGDAELERIKVNLRNCWLGFLIQDDQQKVHYTEVLQVE